MTRGDTSMPAVETCARCKKKIDPETEKFVVVQEKYQYAPRIIVHVPCAQQPSGSRIRYAVVKKGL
jgi:hypothetical protein